jgi:hypothetical protein
LFFNKKYDKIAATKIIINRDKKVQKAATIIPYFSIKI